MALTQEEINEYVIESSISYVKEQKVYQEEQERLCQEMGMKAYIEMITKQAIQEGGLQ